MGAPHHRHGAHWARAVTTITTKSMAHAHAQGDDPSTDFRGAGFYGLENLIFLGEAYPETFRRGGHGQGQGAGACRSPPQSELCPERAGLCMSLKQG